MRAVSFSQLITDVTSKFSKIKKQDFLKSGLYPIIDQSKNTIAGYTNKTEFIQDNFPELIVFGDHTRIFKYIDMPVALGADGAKALIVNPQIALPKYIYYYFRTINIENAGYSRHFKFLKNKRIPIPYKDNIPDFTAQAKIINLLSRVEKLIETRKSNIKQLDTLVKSTFIEIFGDPVKNEMDWEPAAISDLVDEVKYGTSSSAQGGKQKYLRMNNIDYNGYWDFSDLKYIDVNEKDYDKYSIRKDDLVFNRTNSKELVGKTAVFDQDEEMIIAGYLIRVRTNVDNNPWYIWGYLNSYIGKEKLFNLCRSIVGMANINAQELQKIKVHKTPLELQNKFEKIVKRILVLKEKYQHNLTELENLYGSISQKAFKGELDLSKVELPEPEGISPHSEFVKSENRVPVTIDFPTAIKAENREQPTLTDNKIRPLIDVAKDKSNQEKKSIEKEISLSQHPLEQWQPSKTANLFSEYPMSDPATRTDLILSVFDEFVSFHKGQKLPIEKFWAQLEISTVDYMDEGVQPIGVSDYEVIKKRLFELIEENKVVQEFDDENENKMELKVNS